VEFAYSGAIADSDIGLIVRNIDLSSKVSAILKLCFSDKETFLDYGGGYGMFVRMMRDYGFDFHWYDKYCKNLFANHFEKQDIHYDILTAFELFEHFADPIGEIERMLACADNIIFSTELVPVDVPKIALWWYYAPETGQHIAFYTDRALASLAKRYGKNYLHCGSIHVFSEKKIERKKLWIACRFDKYLNKLLKKNSLLGTDYYVLTGKHLE